MSIKNYTPLNLMAADREDLNVMSACLQDAVAKVGDMAFLPKERRFALVANRFVWEDNVSKKLGPFVRVRSGIHFDDVLQVKSFGIDQNAKGAVVAILAIKQEDSAETMNDIVTLELAGGGKIQLEVEGINATLSDISSPWRTQNKPDHEKA